MPTGVYPRPPRKRCINHPERFAAGRGLCRSCFYKGSRQRVRDRKAHLKRKYNMTPEAFNNLLAQQGGHCAMCPTTIEQWKDGVPKHLAVDHDHKTNQIRGILCSRCNLFLGLAEEGGDPWLRMLSVMRYLKQDPTFLSLGIGSRYHSEVNIPFIVGMLSRMATSFEKYGPIRDGFPHKINAIESLKLRLARYEQTGNIEYLMDVSNFAMIEATLPRHPSAHFKAEDSHASPGRVHNTGLTSQAANTIQHESVRVGGFYQREGD